MANQHSSAMQTLITLESKEADRAAQKLSAANRTVKEAEMSLQMLMDYRRDYLAQFAEVSKSGVANQSYYNFQRFIQKLEQAIQGQQDAIASYKLAANKAMTEWQSHERKKLSYGVILLNADKKNQLAILKKEQKMMDESAMRSTRAQFLKSNIR